MIWKETAEIVQTLLAQVKRLEEIHHERHFTLDGHLVGSLGECYAAAVYGLELATAGTKGWDARKGELKVEIKTTMKNAIAIRSEPEHLLVLKMLEDGAFLEIYNGPGPPIWELTKERAKPKTGQYLMQLSTLERCMEDVPEGKRLSHVPSG